MANSAHLWARFPTKTNARVVAFKFLPTWFVTPRTVAFLTAKLRALEVRANPLTAFLKQ